MICETCCTSCVSDITDKRHQIARLLPDLARAADKYGTPVYVIDMASVDATARQIAAAFGGPWLLHYSLKANDLPAIAGYLARRSWGGAVVSTGEWQRAAHAGLTNDAIVFEGIGKTDAQLEYAVAEAAAGRGALRETAVEGPVCESTDSFGIHQLPSLKRDDLVAIDQAGACAASFTSRYNGRPQPAEVLLWPDGSMQRCRSPDITTPVMSSSETYLCDLAPALTGSSDPVLHYPTTAQPRHRG